jgi:hypothetical protein
MATAHAKEILEEINKLRANPAAYADRVQEYISYFTDKTMKIPGINVQVRTQEGDAPYKETVEFLKAQEPVNPMTPSKGLCQIAQEILDKVVDSETGEIEEDETERIIDSHGTFSGKFTRAMDFGGFTSEQIVINFLVCDGDPERTQREPLLGKGLQKVGVAYGKHNIYSTICVLVSCTEFTNTKENDMPSFPKFINPIEEQKKKQLELQKQIEEEEKRKEEEKKKEEEKRKRAEERKKREEERKKKEEERKKKEEERKKQGDPFKLPKNKFFAVTAVSKEQLPEGVASMTTRDTVVIEGGIRYKKIITTKIMTDGRRETEEVKKCLDF